MQIGFSNGNSMSYYLAFFSKQTYFNSDITSKIRIQLFCSLRQKTAMV